MGPRAHGREHIDRFWGTHMRFEELFEMYSGTRDAISTNHLSNVNTGV